MLPGKGKEREVYTRKRAFYVVLHKIVIAPDSCNEITWGIKFLLTNKKKQT